MRGICCEFSLGYQSYILFGLPVVECIGGDVTVSPPRFGLCLPPPPSAPVDRDVTGLGAHRTVVYVDVARVAC